MTLLLANHAHATKDYCKDISKPLQY